MVYVLRVDLTVSADSLDMGCERKELKNKQNLGLGS